MRVLLVACLLLTACPWTEKPVVTTPPKDPYVTARAVVQNAQLLVAAADGIFELWIALNPKMLDVGVRKLYLKIKNAVVDGLRLALDGIAVAESQKAGFDLAKLMGPASVAYQDLLKFIDGLKALPSAGPPTSAPAVPASAPLPPLPPTLMGK